MTTRGDRTREQIIAAAELLFAERGLFAVSLREINLAAGQRNTAALHYHFRGREGVLQAIAAKHLPVVDARQRERLNELQASGRGDELRLLVEAVLQPQAEYIEMGPSERAWMKICASWVSNPGWSTGQLNAAGTATGRELRLGIVELLRTHMPAELARERVFVTYTAALHVLADRARLLDTTDPRRAVVSEALFSTNLCDMSCGALMAPVSAVAGEPLLDR